MTRAGVIGYGVFALRTAPVLLVSVFTIAYLIALHAFSLLGIPLVVLLLSWFFKYAFVLFDHTTRGFVLRKLPGWQ